MFDVLVVGELNVDIILDKIDGFPEIGKEKLAENFTMTLGSSAAIFACNLATLGAKVSFLGKTGDDSFANLIVDTFKNKKVSTDKIIRSADLSTGSTTILNYDMDRAMVTYPGAMEHLSSNEISNDLLKTARHLHVSSIFLQPKLKEGIIDLFKRSKELGLNTSLDPQWDPQENWDLDLERLLPFVDVFLPNRKELQLLTQTTSLEDGINAVKNFANTLVIKNGENGASVYSDGVLYTKEAFLNKNVADCIGAGDSFDAGFVSKYIKGQSIESCLEFANLIGAINTTESGGTTAFQSLELIKKIARERFSINLS